MAARPANPDRYVVDRIGTPDPSNSVYYVLELVNDFDCRVALAKLGTLYRMRGKEQMAQQIFDLLHATGEQHQAAVENHNKHLVSREKKGAKQGAN